MELESGRYDTVFCRNVLEHVEEPRAALEEFARVLGTGGTAIVSVPHLSYLHNEPTDFYRFTSHGLRYLVSKTDLELVYVRPAGRLFSFLGWSLSTFLLGMTYHLPVVSRLVLGANRTLQLLFVGLDDSTNSIEYFPAELRDGRQVAVIPAARASSGGDTACDEGAAPLGPRNPETASAPSYAVRGPRLVAGADPDGLYPSRSQTDSSGIEFPRCRRYRVERAQVGLCSFASLSILTKMVDSGITLGLKTFLRPGKLDSCLEHIGQLSPAPERVIVADDSPRKDLNEPVYNRFVDELPLTVIELPPDAGLARGRNRILDETETEYLFIIDDDHYLPKEALRLKGVLEDEPSLGGIAASWVEDGRLKTPAADIDVVDGWVIVDVFDERPLLRSSGVGFFEYDFVPNSALFRTETLYDYHWDENYVFDGEHVDFFFAHSRLTPWEFAVTTDVRVRHDPGPGLVPEYADHRTNQQKRRRSRAYFAKKWGVKGYVIRSYHQDSYDTVLEGVAGKVLYGLPPVVHWELKQRGHLDRMTSAIRRITPSPVH